MKSLPLTLLSGCLLLLASCAGGGKDNGNDHLAAEGLSDRLNRNYGYQVDDKGNWVPRTDKRSQYEGRGGSAYFNGEVGKKTFQAEQLQKGSWMGNKPYDRKAHRLNGAQSDLGAPSRLSNQQASLEHRLQTPEHITGNHLPNNRAHESSTGSIERPSDAETDVRRRVYGRPDIIDYRQQRDLSIQQSKQLLGRDE